MSDRTLTYGTQHYVLARLVPPQPSVSAFAALEGRSLPFRLLARLARWMDTRRGRLDLLQLSDHQLKDIGLSRSAAYNDFYEMCRIAMSQLSCQTILATSTVTLRDVVCDGSCRGRGAEECAHSTSLVYPYRGVFMRHVGGTDAVAESNQLIFFNRGEDYRVSHPVAGGDACLDVKASEEVLAELAPKEELRSGGDVSFRRQRRRIDARAQALVALLRHSLARGVAETLEAETLTSRSSGTPLANGRHMGRPALMVARSWSTARSWCFRAILLAAGHSARSRRRWVSRLSI